MEPQTDSSVEEALALKGKANDAFKEKRFDQATLFYTLAIEVCPSGDDGKEHLHVLHSNRSASYCGLAKFAEALQDAQVAIDLAPTYLKAYHRKATAEQHLGLHREAHLTYLAAVKTCTEKSAWLTKQVKEAARRAEKEDLGGDVTTEERFVQIFEFIEDRRLRLALLASLWNLSTPAERHATFTRFLQVISGSVQMVQGADFLVENMTELPMDNYGDITLPSKWLGFFKSLAPQQKTAVFESCWVLCSEEDRTLIMHDLRHYFDKGKDDEKGEGED